MLSIFTCAHAAADEDAALLIPDFTKPITLHIGRDGFSEALKLKALDGVDNYTHLAPGSNLDPSARSLDFVPCETQGTNQFSTRVSRLGVYIVGYNLDPGQFDSWLTTSRFIENATFNIRYPWAEQNNARYPAQQVRTVNTFVCPIINENIGKYLPSFQVSNLHNGLDIAIGRRVLTKWTFRNRYDTPLPGKGNVKIFAGTFAYKIVPTIPIVSFAGEGTARVKLFLDPDTGRWTIEHWEKQDPAITLTTNPIAPSKTTASAMEVETKAQLAREKAAHEQQLENARALQRIVERLSGQWIGEWQVTGLQNPIATNKGNFNLDLQNNSSVLSGSYSEKSASSSITGQVDGNQISFEYRYSDGSSRKYVGTINAQGVVSGQWTQLNFTGTWTMTQSRSVATEQPSQIPPSASLSPPTPAQIVANQGVPSRQSSQIPPPAFIPRPPETFNCVRDASLRATLVVDYTNSTVRSLDGYGGIRAGVRAQITDATISWRNQEVKNYGGGGMFYFFGSIDRATRVFTFNIRGANTNTLIFECR